MEGIIITLKTDDKFTEIEKGWYENDIKTTKEF